MPSDIPLSISKSAIATATAGLALRSRARNDDRMNPAKIAVINSAGTVPRPNSTIYSDADPTDPVVVAAARPMYKNPQGKNPLRIPMPNCER